MTKASYLIGRKKWSRPQGMLWSDGPGTLVNIDPSNPSLGSMYVPTGYEVMSQKYVRSVVTPFAVVSSITGSGPWTATITTAQYIGDIQVGSTFTATNSTGSIGSGGTYTVSSIISDSSFTFTATGGTTPTNGSVLQVNFNVTVGSVTGSGPWTATISNVPNIENVLVGSTITAVGVTGSIGSGGTYTVQSVNTSAKSFTYTAVGGTSPLNGTVKTLVVSPTTSMLSDSFLILSDHNRSEINISNQRIEQKQRMVNGSMRSYHIADKLNISTSWNLLPSRSFQFIPFFNQTTGESIYENSSDLQYTADNGAGGAEMLDWYQNHTGPFWVFLSYDKYTNFGTLDQTTDIPRIQLGEYSQIVQMYISSFDYSIVKRGRENYDMWNISVSLEEV